MFNPNSIKVPLKNFPTHVVFSPVFFFTEEEFFLNKKSSSILQDGEVIFVYEHGIGSGGKWCKIKTSDQRIGYIEFLGTIATLPEYKPFFSVNGEAKNLPDITAPEINWKAQTPNIPYEDTRNGAFIVHCELEDTVVVGDSTALAAHMDEARKKGTKLILDHTGFKYDEQQLQKLLNDFYSFSTAEDWYIDVRPCSTLRVAVAIPKRYLYAKTDVGGRGLTNTTGTSIPTPDMVSDDSIATDISQNTPVIDTDFVLKFENYQKYKFFFDNLTLTLGMYQTALLTKLWIITPDVGLNLLSEIGNIKMFVESTNKLISVNQPQKIKSTSVNFLLPPELVWENSLDFIIDKKTITLKAVKYYSQGRQYTLNTGLLAYKRSPEVLNKTTINYCMSFDPIKDAPDPLHLQDIVEKAQNLSSSVTTDLSNSISDTVSLADDSTSIISNAFSTLNSTSSVAANATSLLGSVADNATSLLGSVAGSVASLSTLSADIDKQVRNFLTTKHYPTIIDMTEQTLDLFNSIIDTGTRVADLNSIRERAERSKWLNINKAYEKNKIKIEGDLFMRSILERDLIKDKNMRILFGIDTMPGVSPKDKLAKYISIAKSLDWAKFLGVAAQCLSQPIPIEDLLKLMDKYKDAQEFIEQILSGSVYNTYLKNGLKFINGFELPVLKAYNPSETLARELETIFIKIINDLISFGIQKALEAAAKACTSNPNANFNASGSPANPFGSSPAAADTALSDVFNESLSPLNSASGVMSAAEKEAAMEKFKNIIQDITACMSLKEMCSLYSGSTVNDEVYQVIISLVKRKYGSPFSEAFGTREQVARFFRTLGNKLDLTICTDILSPETPSSANSGINILCDDGSVKKLREQILADHGLTPDLIDAALESLKNDEIKALEDVLKLLNSDNPFDFSQVPDLGCKIFPSGETIAPSMQSFTSMLNSMLRSVYDSFDREAEEWYKTSYSVKSSKPSILKFNLGDIDHEGEIVTIPASEITIDKNQTLSLKANSPKASEAERKEYEALSGSASTGIEETKLPSFIFKDLLSNPVSGSVKFENLGDASYILYSNNINGNDQLKLDLNFIDTQLTEKIQTEEIRLLGFAKKLWKEVLRVHGQDISNAVKNLSINEAYDISSSKAFKDLSPLVGLLYTIDSFLRSNVADAEELRFKLKDAYKVLGIGDAQEANGFFAAENGTAIYLVICEMLLTNVKVRSAIINGLGFQPQELLDITTNYVNVKSFYRTMLKVKINYPDFDVDYQTGIDNLKVNDTLSVPMFDGTRFYDIQKLKIQKNKKNFIKITEINNVSSDINQYITSLFEARESDSRRILVPNSKANIFTRYIKNKQEKYGFINKQGTLMGTPVDEPREYIYVCFEDLNDRIYKNISNKILSKDNKFLLLKDLSSDQVSAATESGSGQPYTQYLKLVVKQTANQKACGIRPHYLDIDSIKNNIADEKSSNLCIEKIADSRVVGNKPINPDELKEIETTSTQNSMLRGMYDLTTRIFLHDILLRGISIFGYYDPQSLRDEPAFISFMAKMVESEMRSTDNAFFVLLSEFLFRSYKDKNPDAKTVNEENKKSQLFRDLVGKELKNYVLPKLAKRINADTNLALVGNTPKDNPINLINLNDDIANMDVISVSGTGVYIKLKLKYAPVAVGSRPDVFIYQKIYESKNARGTFLEGNDLLKAFISDPEFDFLFKFLFPISHTLNNFFILNCLSTCTRKQLVNNVFRGTKNDIMTTCKVIQANGQEIAKNPNDAQSMAVDPMEIIMGFIVQTLFKTPIGIIKGMAEITEPNIALTSTAFKVARIFVPKLPSFIIPAVSIPLGTIISPFTCPLPFTNPLLAIAYFATLAWYDEKPLDDMVNDASSNLEKNMSSAAGVVCKDTFNQDLYYLDRSNPIQTGKYKLEEDAAVINATSQKRLPVLPSRIISTNTLTVAPQTTQQGFGAAATVEEVVNTATPRGAGGRITSQLNAQVSSDNAPPTPQELTPAQIRESVLVRVQAATYERSTIGAMFSTATELISLKTLINVEVNSAGNNHEITSLQDPKYTTAVNRSIISAKIYLAERDDPSGGLN